MPSSILGCQTEPIPPVNELAYLSRSFRLLLRGGLTRELVRKTWGQLFGKVTDVGLALEMGSRPEVQDRRVNLDVRPFGNGDEIHLSAVLTDKALPAEEKIEVIRRMSMLATDLKTCYVVDGPDGNPRFLQWLILSGESENLSRISHNWYPNLENGEALMEFAYVFPKYRGTGMLPSGVRKVLDIASSLGVVRIKTPIPATNTNSLASFMRLGFRPYELHVERRVFGFRLKKIRSLPPGLDLPGLRKILDKSSLPGPSGITA